MFRWSYWFMVSMGGEVYFWGFKWFFFFFFYMPAQEEEEGFELETFASLGMVLANLIIS